MIHVKNVDRDILNLKFDNETSLSHSCSHDAALSGSYAIRILPAGEVCGDGGVWHHGLSLL